MNRRCMGVFISVVVAVLLIFSGTVSAQVSITAGVKGGPNIMMPYGDDFSFLQPVFQYVLSGPFEISYPGGYPIDLGDSSSVTVSGLGAKMGYVFGGFVCIQFNEYFAIQPELTYIRKGGKQDVRINASILNIPIVDINGEIGWKLDYIEIPLLLKVYLPTAGKYSPNFYLGPALAFKSSAKIYGKLGPVDEDLDVDPIISSTEIGMIIGGGLDIDISGNVIATFEGRFGLGFTNWFDLPIDIFDVKNSNISFTAGLAYRFGN